MKKRFVTCCAVVGMLLVNCASLSAATFLQQVSTPGSFSVPSVGGGGDSGVPVLSADGRFVLFASTANNLVLTTNGTPIPALNPPSLNVYLRDRASNTTTLVSFNLAGTGGGNGDSLPVQISTNGQFVLFESTASDLVAGDTNGVGDVFVRDLVANTTTLASVATDGGSGNDESHGPMMTPDGRYVAFVSSATNLVAGDTNGIADVFVRDLQTGTTMLASVGAVSIFSTSLTSLSESPQITTDGRYIAFFSTATNLVPGVQAAGEVYVRDLVSESTILASTNARSLFQSLSGRTNAISCNQRISDDGSYVVFEAGVDSFAGGLASGVILRYSIVSGLTDIIYTNANKPLISYQDISTLDITPDGLEIAFIANVADISGTNTAIYLWDTLNGSNSPVSVDWNNAVPSGANCDAPSISADGRYVAFFCNVPLTTNAPTGCHLYVRDVQAGTTRLMDVNTNGLGAGVNLGTVPILSTDGNLVVFESADSGLVAGDRNRRSDVFIRNLGAGTTDMISVRHPVLPSLSPNSMGMLFTPSVSADGRYTAFVSDGDDLVTGDTNGLRDVFVRDFLLQTNLLVSVNTNGVAASGLSFQPTISGSGRYVAFSSSASDLVPGDTNGVQDVFVRDLIAGTTALVSVKNSAFGVGLNASYSPVISADGRFVLFRITASGSESLYLRDRQTNVTKKLTNTSSSLASISLDSRFVAYVDFGRICLWDTHAAAQIANISTSSGIKAIAISPEGNRIACFAGSGTPTLSILDRAANTNWVAGSGYPSSFPGLRFSLDGRFLVYAAAPTSGGTNQVYLHDCRTRTTLLVSYATNSLVGGDGTSDSPDISADGRFVAYRSAADNLVAGDTNGVPDVFIYDRLLSATTLLSGNGTSSGNNRSFQPVFSGDGRTLLFQSLASDLVANDFNQSSDLIAFVFLYASVAPGAGPGEGSTISWPAVPGHTYHVEFKNNLGDTDWQDVAGTVIVTGNQGHLTDNAPAASHRFYRVVAN